MYILFSNENCLLQAKFIRHTKLHQMVNMLMYHGQLISALFIHQFEHASNNTLV
jgi:hypothetical protein